jgi:hypothetical protein
LKRNAAGQFNRSKTDAAAQAFKISADLSPFNAAEPGEEPIDPRERRSRFIGCVNYQRCLLLPQEQQTQRMIDIGICQKDACDRSVTHGFATRLQSWRVFDLS